MPEVIIVKDQDEAGELYARCVADLIKGKPDAVLGLATGSSPLARLPSPRRHGEGRGHRRVEGARFRA